MCWRFESPFYKHSPLHGTSQYFPNSSRLTFFANISPVLHGLNTKINSWGTVISSCLQEYKTKLRTLHSFISNTLYDTSGWDFLPNNNSACIKMIWKKNKYCKWKTCWVKSIIATKSMHPHQKAVFLPSIDTPPPHPPPPPFTAFMDYPSFLQ